MFADAIINTCAKCLMNRLRIVEFRNFTCGYLLVHYNVRFLKLEKKCIFQPEYA